MVKTGATFSTFRRAVTRVAVGAVGIVAVGTLAACGGDSGGDATEKNPDNPGLQFSGTYMVDVKTSSVNGEPPKPANGPTTSAYTWVIQSTCDGPGDSCVAIAASTAPDPKRPLNMDRMEFVYQNGSWSRVFVPNERECVAYATGKPVVEPWVAMHTTKLTTDDKSGDEPIATLTGTYEGIQGGTCSTRALGELTLTRTGDVPTTSKPLGTTVATPVVANPPGAAWTGTYDASSKPVSATPPSFITSAKAQTERYTISPTCTRTGEQCVVATNPPSGSQPAVYTYVNGGYERSSLGPKLNCTNGTTGYSRRTYRFDLPADAGSPIKTLTSKQTLEVFGGCPGTVQIEGTAVRTGD